MRRSQVFFFRIDRDRARFQGPEFILSTSVFVGVHRGDLMNKQKHSTTDITLDIAALYQVWWGLTIQVILDLARVGTVTGTFVNNVDSHSMGAGRYEIIPLSSARASI